MQQDELQQFHTTFFEEATEHVHTLEERLLELEARPGDLELLNALFRAAHSVKGSSGMLGFEIISQLTHSMENVLDDLREGRVQSSSALTSALLSATDLLGNCIDAARSSQPAPDVTAVVAQLEAISSTHAPQATSRAESEQTTSTSQQWQIIFRPRPETFGFGINPALVLRDLATHGVTHVEALVDTLPAFSALDPEKCHLGWRIDLTSASPEATLREVFMFVEDTCDLDFKRIVDEHHDDQAGGVFTPLPSAPQPNASAPRGHDGKNAESSTLRVSTEKVDRLVNLVGELVISQAMISRSVQNLTPDELPRLRDAIAEMERHTRELQDRVMNIRMVPIGSIFGRFRRLVRDLSGSLGKDLHLETQGDDTELDKSMVELLADPLTHLVRNSCDHGIETSERRIALGKPAQGTITLTAKHQGGNVVVDVIDDGNGLDTSKIVAKAIERGLVSPAQQLTDEQIHDLIFAPGFSTANSVTDLSGRGVGMDVVKRSVEALNGTISVSSSPGLGARFRMTLPLTLAILDGMALRVGQSTFVLPLNQVIETLSLGNKGVKRLMANAEVILVRGETLPLLRLARLLSVDDDGDANVRQLAVVLESGDVRFAMLVDELLGKSQYVIKNLEPNFQKLEGLLGATILGDGTVSLILDVQSLARMGNVRSRDERDPHSRATTRQESFA